MTNDARPLCSLSLDLDNQWSYMKTHGDAGWDAFPSYLDMLVPIVLERLRRHGLSITVFVVGQDAALPRNGAALRELADAGHEIGNHSFHHEPWLQFYGPAEVRDEIVRAEEAIATATGCLPRGFRGPGFSFSADLLRVLADRGYAYDASTFPTFLGPLARAYYFWTSRGMPAEERRKRRLLFGRASDVLRPNKPYGWNFADGRELLEIPVTTMPLLRVPIHQSYLVYLARRSRWLARRYLGLALALCRATRTEPSFLLHPLDFLGGDRLSALSFFPGMDLPTARKLALFDDTLQQLARRFRPVGMAAHAAAIRARRVTLRPLPAPVSA